MKTSFFFEYVPQTGHVFRGKKYPKNVPCLALTLFQHYCVLFDCRQDVGGKRPIIRKGDDQKIQSAFRAQEFSENNCLSSKIALCLGKDWNSKQSIISKNTCMLIIACENFSNFYGCSCQVELI